MKDIIKVEDVRFNYGGQVPALDGVTLGVSAGERCAIIGANGSGKSTLLQIMAGLVYPQSGAVFFKDRRISEESLREKSFLKFFREKVGYVFQDSDIQLFCPTVLDELLYGPLQLDIGQDEALERVYGIMKMLRIEGLRDRPSYMLSGGEKKRVAIGAVLTMNPDVLLFDEPTNGLDPRTQCFLMELLIALSEAGKTIIIATHDLSLVEELHARVAVLSEEHRLERTGIAEEILRDEELLLKVNLIHEHRHFHGQTAHSHLHSHFTFHQHDGGIKSHDHKSTATDTEVKTMNDLAKLKHLIHHWKEHNDEHADTYREWAQKAAELGNPEVAEILANISRETEKLSGMFKDAETKIP